MANDTLKPEKVRFYYQKAQDFKVLPAHGVVGSLTPKGEIQLNFFIERVPIPQQTVHSVDDGRLTDAEEVISKRGIIRDVSVGLVIDKQTAENISGWLQNQIQDLEAREKAGNKS